MDLSFRDSGDVKVVEVVGRLDTGTAPDAEKQLMALIDDGATKIVLNLDALDYVSSAGLRIFLATAKKLKTVSGELRVCGLNATVQEIFDISGFGTILNVSKTEEEALAGL